MEKMVIDKNFWKGKTVFLTGHTGFKGSWLALWLQSLGVKVVGYALAAPTNPSLFELAKVSDGMTSIEGNVLNLDFLKIIIEKCQPDIIIHMAAQSLVRYSYKNPVETYSTNVMGTVNILEAMRQSKSAKVLINVTSDKCYENKEWLWGYRENEPMGGFDPYSSSKGCAELITSAYRNSYFNSKDFIKHGKAIATARAGNVIGGGDWAEDRLIPDIIRAILQNQVVHIRNPNAIRPWQHVLEPLSGYLLLAQKLWVEGTSFSEAWNFGPFENDAQPVAWVADRLTSMWGKNAKWVIAEGEHPHEANYLKLDCLKAKTLLNWLPHWKLEMALEQVIVWYKAFDQKKDMRQISLQQINKYSN